MYQFWGGADKPSFVEATTERWDYAGKILFDCVWPEGPWWLGQAAWQWSLQPVTSMGWRHPCHHHGKVHTLFFYAQRLCWMLAREDSNELCWSLVVASRAQEACACRLVSGGWNHGSLHSVRPWPFLHSVAFDSSTTSWQFWISFLISSDTDTMAIAAR